MAQNIGEAPPNFETLIGQMRAVLGDTSYEELDPPVTGEGSYKFFGDAELEAFLVAGDGLLEGALALAYNSLATSAAIEAKSIKDFDLQVSTEKRATELRLLADRWSAKADALTAEVFELTFPDQGYCDPELAARAYRGC